MMFGRNDGIDRVVNDIRRGSTGVEVGVWRGDSSARLLQKAGFLHLVDPWAVTAYADSDEFGNYQSYLARYSKLVGSADPAAFQAYYDGVYESVQDRFKNSPVTIHRCKSHEFFETFGGRVDWVYIDGAHSYDGCLSDLEDAACITDTIYGDDYLTKEGVTKAVREFLDLVPEAEFKGLGRRQYKITF